MVAFAGILPEQFSVRIHDSLPLLTVSRVLILLTAAFWLVERIKKRRLTVPKSLLIFFGVNIALALFHLFFDLDEIKHIAILLMERALVVIMLADMIETREEFERCIDFSVLGCCALAVIGLCQTVLDYDLASVLHLTETMASISITARMGLTRAFGTFNAISYGCYCAVMLLLIYYRLEKTRLLRYALAFAVTFAAFVCTFSRSSWVCAAAVFFVLLLLGRKVFLQRMWPTAAMAVALCAVLCLPQPKLLKAYGETGKSVLNTVLAVLPSDSASKDNAPSSSTEEPIEEPEEPEKEPVFELDEEFGLNANDPSYTRMAQWTAVEYMTGEGKLIAGYGYNAFPEGKLHYRFDRWDTGWITGRMLDVGLVAVMTEGGLIGIGSLLALLVFMMIYAWKHKDKRGGFDFYRAMLYIVPLYLMMNFTSSFPNGGTIWLIWGLFYAYKRLDETLPPEEAPALPTKKWQF